MIVEKYKRHQPPSETAAAMLRRNYDTKWIDKYNATTELKKQEFELRKAISESNNFDLDWEEKNGCFMIPDQNIIIFCILITRDQMHVKMKYCLSSNFMIILHNIKSIAL